MNQSVEEAEFLQAGLLAHKNDDLELAEKEYRQALAINPHNPDALHLLGYLAYQLDFPEEGISLIEDAIEIAPTNTLFFNNIASVYKSIDENDKAIGAYRNSIDLRGDDPDVLNDLGTLLAGSDQFKVDMEVTNEAEKLIRKAITLSSGNAKFHNNLGCILQNLRPPQIEKAEKSFHRALKLDPGLAGAMTNLGLIAQAKDDGDLADELFEKAVTLEPQSAETQNNYAQFLVTRKFFGKAIDHFDKAQVLLPGNYTICLNKSLCLMALRRDEEALESLHDLMQINQSRVDAYRHFAVTLRKMENLTEAQTFVHEALKLFPGDIHLRHQIASIHVAAFEMKAAQSILEEIIEEVGEGNLAYGGAGIYATLGIIYLETGTVEQVEEMFRIAMKIDPDNPTAMNNYAMALLATGNLEEGWKHYKNRWLSEDFTSPIRPFQKPIWDGQSSLQGKTIALYGEQGVGDEIRYASLIPDMLDKGANIVIECDPRLVPLYERSFAGTKVYGREKDLSVPYEDDCDFQIPIVDLAGIFRPTLDSFPTRPFTFLKADPDKAEFWRQRLADLGPRPKVGVVWRSIVVGGGRMPHYALVEELEPILTLPGVDIINLMYAESSEDRALATDRFGVEIHTWDDIDLRDDLDGLTALLSNLDVVISPWTAVVPHATALDIPVLAFSTTRRMPELFGDPAAPGWSPSMKVFFKDFEEPWQQVMIDMADEIKGMFSLS